MLENRMVMRDVFPELFTRYKVSSIHQYSNKLYQSMIECIPKKTDNPHMVVLTPGIYNSAYFEHSFLEAINALKTKKLKVKALQEN